jgi:hypothetical protein
MEIRPLRFCLFVCLFGEPGTILFSLFQVDVCNSTSYSVHSQLYLGFSFAFECKATCATYFRLDSRETGISQGITGAIPLSMSRVL